MGFWWLQGQQMTEREKIDYLLGVLNENRISVLEIKSGSTSSANEIQFFFHFCQRNYVKITKCQVKLIYKSFHQTVKYGRQRNHL